MRLINHNFEFNLRYNKLNLNRMKEFPTHVSLKMTHLSHVTFAILQVFSPSNKHRKLIFNRIFILLLKITTQYRLWCTKICCCRYVYKTETSGNTYRTLDIFLIIQSSLAFMQNYLFTVLHKIYIIYYFIIIFVVVA